VVIRIESAAGARRAPPRPCSARNAISEVSDHASPERSELAAKSATPARNKRLRPSRSASRPPSRSAPPKRIAYAVTTHCSPRSHAPSWAAAGAALEHLLPAQADRDAREGARGGRFRGDRPEPVPPRSARAARGGSARDAGADRGRTRL